MTGAATGASTGATTSTAVGRTGADPAATTHVSARTAATSATRRGRLEFLDALRGLAAFAVVCQHAAEALWPGYLKFSVTVFRPGEFGVFLFFLCSGFIIPASLERRGSLREFWIGRVFRLFPLYLTAVALALISYYALHRFFLPDAIVHHPRRTILMNVTMVQDFLDSRLLVIGASWSLAYEMVFYLAVSLLFLAHLHRRSVPTSLIVLCAGGAVGTLVPVALLHQHDRATIALVLFTFLLGAFVFLRLVPPAMSQRLAALLLLALIVPLVLNRPEPAWFALIVFGTMFTGTVLYRATEGTLPTRTAWLVFGAACAIVLAATYAYVDPHREPETGALLTWRAEALTYGAAYLVFGLAFLLRRYRFPRPFIALGAVSYSLYLMHPLVLYGVPWWGAHRTLTFLRWVVLAIIAATITYHLVEKPAIRMGRRITRGVGARERAGHAVPAQQVPKEAEAASSAQVV